MRTRAGVRARVAVLACCLVGLAACDQGPDGPREVLGTVTGDPALGAALLDVTWQGIQGVGGRGDTQAYAAAVAGAESRHRILLLHAGGGELRFSVQLSGAGGDAPAFTIVAAADTADRPLPATGLSVVLAR